MRLYVEKRVQVQDRWKKRSQKTSDWLYVCFIYWPPHIFIPLPDRMVFQRMKRLPDWFHPLLVSSFLFLYIMLLQPPSRENMVQFGIISFKNGTRVQTNISNGLSSRNSQSTLLRLPRLTGKSSSVNSIRICISLEAFLEVTLRQEFRNWRSALWSLVVLRVVWSFYTTESYLSLPSTGSNFSFLFPHSMSLLKCFWL